MRCETNHNISKIFVFINLSNYQVSVLLPVLVYNSISENIYDKKGQQLTLGVAGPFLESV